MKNRGQKSVEPWEVRLSALEGLLRNVFPELRAVCVDSKENLIQVCFYRDGEISEEQSHCCKSAIDHITCDFSHIKGLAFKTPIIQLDFPKKPPLVGFWA